MTAIDDITYGGAIVRDGKIVLVRERNEKDAIIWSYPKGHPEKGEPPIETAYREIEEETGLKRDDLTGGTSLTLIVRDSSGTGRQKGVQLFYFETKKKELKPKDTEKIIEAKWIPLGGTRDYLTKPEDWGLASIIANIYAMAQGTIDEEEQLCTNIDYS